MVVWRFQLPTCILPFLMYVYRLYILTNPLFMSNMAHSFGHTLHWFGFSKTWRNVFWIFKTPCYVINYKAELYCFISPNLVDWRCIKGLSFLRSVRFYKMGIFCLISIKVYRKLFLRNIFTKFKDKNIGLFFGGSG